KGCGRPLRRTARRRSAVLASARSAGENSSPSKRGAAVGDTGAVATALAGCRALNRYSPPPPITASASTPSPILAKRLIIFPKSPDAIPRSTGARRGQQGGASVYRYV